MGADDAFGEQHEPEAKTSISLLESAAERFDWVDLRGFAPHASAREAGQATTAISLGVWHARQRHCPACGAPTEPALEEAQRCTSEADGKRLLFPRVEPAVITAIVDHEDRLLLQHNSAWRNTGLRTCIGRLRGSRRKPGACACRREAKEEVGIDIGELKYRDRSHGRSPHRS